MNALNGSSLRNHWIANAQRLAKKGHFANYSPKQRDEILKKGFLGPYPPDQAIGMAREQAERGLGFRTSKFNDNMRECFGTVGAEVREKLLRVLDEVPPESYEPPYELNEPPGCPFIFPSTVLGCDVFFKFQIAGTAKKPRVLFWSCHPPLYGVKRREL
jgi:hypothetical protein